MEVISDIEKCFRSTCTCLLGNVALRSKMRLDWDEREMAVSQAAAQGYLSREYRAPWKLVVGERFEREREAGDLQR